MRFIRKNAIQQCGRQKKEFALVKHDAPSHIFFMGDYSAPLSLAAESGVDLVSLLSKDSDVFSGVSNWNDWKLCSLFSFAMGDVRDADV